MRKTRLYMTAAILCLGILQTGCVEEPARESIYPVTLPIEQAESEESSEVTEQLPEITEPVLSTGSNVTEAQQQAAKSVLTEMLHNLEIPEYYGEAIHQVEGENWYSVLLSGFLEGARTYTITEENGDALHVTAGTDIDGSLWTNAYFEGSSSNVIMKYEKERVSFFRFSQVNQLYQGEFEKWILDGETGDVLKETGTYKQGEMSGERVLEKRSGNGREEIFQLWNMRTEYAYERLNEAGEPVATPTPEPTPTPTPTAKPTAKPTATPKPTVKPTVTPTPTPPAATPTPPAATPTPPAATPTPPAAIPTPPAVTSTPETPPTTTPSTGDKDVEWTEDLL